jgi:erythronate-4-phosphate dehydrogenase
MPEYGTFLAKITLKMNESTMKIVADQNIPFVKECFSHMGQVVTVGGRQVTPDLVRDADILLVRSITKVGPDLLEGSTVRFVATATIGFEHVDRDYLDSRRIGFASAPGSNANSVAEYITAALLVLARKKQWTLEGKSIGIVGVGNVGSRVEKKCRALGMKVVLNDPPLQRQTGDARYRPLEEVLGCDFVTLHTPLNKQGPDATFHLADKAFFDRLKSEAVFMNTSRGKVHDETALRQAMEAGRLGAVVLDVWETEPAVNPWLLKNVDISTPHIAGYSYDGKIAGLLMIYQAACRHFGLAVSHTIQDFLPPPDVAEITLSQDDLKRTDEQILHDLVQRIYVLNRDDFNTREILLQPEGEQGAFFDSLRKNYPVRREFQNTVVELPQTRPALAQKIAGIGFQVRTL